MAHHLIAYISSYRRDASFSIHKGIPWFRGGWGWGWPVRCWGLSSLVVLSPRSRMLRASHSWTQQKDKIIRFPSNIMWTSELAFTTTLLSISWLPKLGIKKKEARLLYPNPHQSEDFAIYKRMFGPRCGRVLPQIMICPWQWRRVDNK